MVIRKLRDRYRHDLDAMEIIYSDGRKWMQKAVEIKRRAVDFTPGEVDPKARYAETLKTHPFMVGVPYDKRDDIFSYLQDDDQSHISWGWDAYDEIMIFFDNLAEATMFKLLFCGC